MRFNGGRQESLQRAYPGENLFDGGYKGTGGVAVVIEAQADRPEERQASVFISYSREDKDFVRRLAEALKKHQREIDLESIAPTAEWMAEVYSGIRS